MFGSRIWKITGYVGFNDYDGPEDNNLNEYFIFDKRFSKNDVIDFMCHYYNEKHRTVVITAEKMHEF